MNTRLQQFLLAENISQSQFADTIGVARASVSHILAGRNKPGYDFLEGMMKQFPTLNIEWLMTGKGKMYKNGYQPDLTPFSPSTEDTIPGPIEQIPTQDPEPIYQQNSIPSEQDSEPEAPIAPKTAKKARRIEKVVVFYDDSTYEEIKG